MPITRDRLGRFSAATGKNAKTSLKSSFADYKVRKGLRKLRVASFDADRAVINRIEGRIGGDLNKLRGKMKAARAEYDVAFAQARRVGNKGLLSGLKNVKK